MLKGWAIKYKALREGNRQIVNFILPGDTLGLFSVIFQRSETTVEAITPLTCGIYPSKKIIDLFRDAPRLGVVLGWMAGRDERILEEQIVRIGRRRAAKRMSHLLIELYVRLRQTGFPKHEAARVPVNQMLLSDALGMSHIHGHRVFRELDQMGLIERSSEGVQILDMEKLADFAEFDSSYLETSDFENLSI